MDKTKIEPKRNYPVICKQCGAPLKEGVCEYCGSDYRGKEEYDILLEEPIARYFMGPPMVLRS